MRRRPTFRTALDAPSPLLVGSLSAALLLCIPLAACAQPTSRVITRDAHAGGSAELRLDDMTPMFADERASALQALESGRPALALEAFASPAMSPEGEDLAPFLLAYARFEDGQFRGVAEPASRCAASLPLFADHCLYWAAVAALETDDPAAAERYAAMVDESAVFGPRAQARRADALAALGQFDEAIAVYERFLAAYPGAWYRSEIEFALAAAYEATEQWERAGRVYQNIGLLRPGHRDETRANAAFDALRPRLSEATARELTRRTESQTLDRAEAYLNQRRHEELVAFLLPALDGVANDSETACRGHYYVGKAQRNERQHGDAMPHFEHVIRHCEGQLRMFALYNGGRSAWTIDEDTRAYEMFETLWTDFADESYADDAMLLGARVRSSMGDEAGYRALLRRQIETFPSGDMLGEAVWRLAQTVYDAGDWTGFVRFVDELGTTTGERNAYSRGRLQYFRARSLEHMGLRPEAMAGYRAVIERHPMTWFALLAFNRLHGLDAEGTRALVRTLRAQGGESPGRIEVEPPEVAHDPFFRRGTTLVRLGLFGLAEDEFDKLSGRFPNEDGLAWVLSALYDHVGAYNRSYAVPGGLDVLDLDYPNASNRSRWELSFPRPYAEWVEREAAARDFDPYVVWAIMRQESGFRPDAHSPAGARGLLQLMPATANDMTARLGTADVSARELFEPELNIRLGTELLVMLSERYAGVYPVYFPAYNAGMGRVDGWVRSRASQPLDTWVEHINIDEARRYAKGVTMRYWTYRWLYGSDDDALLLLPFELPPR